MSERLGIGFGFIFPAVQPGGAWGDRDTGVIRNAEGELRPAATRYMGISSSSLGAFPNLSACAFACMVHGLPNLVRADLAEMKVR